MREIHCHGCGGLVTDPASVSYRLASDTAARTAPHSGPCSCAPPIVYGPPPGYLSWPGLASVARSKAAARN